MYLLYKNRSIISPENYPKAARARGPRMPAVMPASPAPVAAVVLMRPYLTRLFLPPRPE